MGICKPTRQRKQRQAYADGGMEAVTIVLGKRLDERVFHPRVWGCTEMEGLDVYKTDGINRVVAITIKKTRGKMFQIAEGEV